MTRLRLWVCLSEVRPEYSQGRVSSEAVSNHDNSGDTPELTLLTTLCGGGSCPTVYRTDRGTLIVQGYTVSADSVDLDLPDGEQLVEIPAELLAAAVRADT